MDIHENYFGFDILKQLINNAKWIIVRSHEHSALQINHGIIDFALLPFIDAPARHSCGIIGGTQQPPRRTMLVAVGRFEVLHDLPLIPNVISSGDDVNAKLEEILGQRRSDAESGSGVFSVGNDEINGVLAHQPRQTIFDDCPSWPSENVTD